MSGIYGPAVMVVPSSQSVADLMAQCSITARDSQPAQTLLQTVTNAHQAPAHNSRLEHGTLISHGHTNVKSDRPKK